LKMGYNRHKYQLSIASRIMRSRFIFLILFFATNYHLAADSLSPMKLKPQNDVGFVMGMAIQSNGDLEKQLLDYYHSTGWSGSDVPLAWLGFDLGFQFKTIGGLYLTPGIKMLYSSVEKTTVWEDIGYSQNETDLNLMYMPTLALKYFIFHKGRHSFSVNGTVSKPYWGSGPEGFSVEPDGIEKGAYFGYEIGNPISAKKRTGYAKAIDRSSRHLVIEAGITSIPVKVNSRNCDFGGVFVNMKAYLGFKDWN